MKFWKKIRLGLAVAAQAQLLVAMWPVVREKLERIAQEDPELAGFLGQVKDLVKQAEKIV